MQRRSKLVPIVSLLVALFSSFLFLAAEAVSPSFASPSLTPTPASPIWRGPRPFPAGSVPSAPLACMPSIRTLPANALVIDDLSAAFGRYGTSGWNAVTGASYYANHAYWRNNVSGPWTAYGYWNFNGIAHTSGIYEVLVFVPAYNATTQSASYQITHDGVNDFCQVNQDQYYSKWVSLGTYFFSGQNTDPNHANFVLLPDATGEITTTQVAYDAVAFVQQGSSQVFLPLILNGAAAKPLPKTKTGIHLGNRDGDWTSDMLSPFLDLPTNPNPQGTWPKIIVAQSRQIFDITRGADCRITGVAVKNWNAYSLLQDASRYNNTQIIIRITPSPGNFQESLTPGWQNASGRTMIPDAYPGYIQTPGNHPQCDPEDLSSTYWENQFRSVADIGDEMIAIQLFVSSQYFDNVTFTHSNKSSPQFRGKTRRNST